MSKKKFHGKGKLLLFGEYAVLDGAKSLAIPTARGQSMEIRPHRGSDLIWENYNEDGELWFEAQISLYDFSSIRTSDDDVSAFIQKILKGAVRFNTEFLNNWNGFKVINRLEFPVGWGLGSSSTVIYNLAQWAGINPFYLHFQVSNGSGYDIACANAENPLIYQSTEDELNYTEIDFNPGCLDQIYFVYLGNKQSSEKAIRYYGKTIKGRKQLVKDISQLTVSAIDCNHQTDLAKIMDEHESVISTALKMPKVKDQRFSDFNGSIKSLGAWGGDFIMVLSDMSLGEINTYFNNKGYDIVIRYNDMLTSMHPVKSVSLAI